MDHVYGGIWTQKKLEVLREYLGFYTTALKNKGFTLHYADAFAGTGSQTPRSVEAQDQLIPVTDLKGSVTRALEVTPGFHRYHFNDLSPEHIQALREVQAKHPHKDIQIYESDANEFVPRFCESLSGKDRAVLLLDPYSTQLNWNTLRYVANSKKVDVWLLFPISALSRMTPRRGDKLQESWRDSITRLLGTDSWEEALYRPKDSAPMDDLFGDVQTEQATERLNMEELQAWVTAQLKTLFPYVAKPVPLHNKGVRLFLFYFAVSNPEKRAWGLAEKAANHIIGKNL
jgi:three-Cys-motif partner protein